jgi:hypothetical protein
LEELQYNNIELNTFLESIIPKKYIGLGEKNLLKKIQTIPTPSYIMGKNNFFSEFITESMSKVKKNNEITDVMSPGLSRAKSSKHISKKSRKNKKKLSREEADSPVIPEPTDLSTTEEKDEKSLTEDKSQRALATKVEEPDELDEFDDLDTEDNNVNEKENKKNEESSTAISDTSISSDISTIEKGEDDHAVVTTSSLHISSGGDIVDDVKSAVKTGYHKVKGGLEGLFDSLRRNVMKDAQPTLPQTVNNGPTLIQAPESLVEQHLQSQQQLPPMPQQMQIPQEQNPIMPQQLPLIPPQMQLPMMQQPQMQIPQEQNPIMPQQLPMMQQQPQMSSLGSAMVTAPISVQGQNLMLPGMVGTSQMGIQTGGSSTKKQKKYKIVQKQDFFF